jgi:hypothetical protein
MSPPVGPRFAMMSEIEPEAVQEIEWLDDQADSSDEDGLDDPHAIDDPRD